MTYHLSAKFKVLDLKWSLRPVARIFRRRVTWMSNLHKHARLGKSGGMLPQESFRN